MLNEPQNQQEIRFAVVLYGGVSLAIYINGVAQEMRNLVRATSGEPFTDDEARGTAPVYQRLAYILRRGQAPRTLPHKSDVITSTETKFLVDVISGTSAGGINGIFLAKSLANNVPMTSLQDLWFNEGAIESLLNDKKSDENTNLARPDETESLLNSRRMYLKLLDAFDGMDGSSRPEKSTDTDAPATSLGDEIDLFATTTDIEGIPIPIQLFDNVVYERRYRNAYHLQYRKGIRNDFQPDNNPFLAFASRSTSSFPFAFEPMRLCSIDEILQRHKIYATRMDCFSDSPRWQRYYANYLSGVNPGSTPFPKRAFGDGGYLNNAPFSYAVDALLKRQSFVPITRKLIYVEPSPDHVETAPPKPPPNAIENSIDALITIPGYQTIRNDLTRVLDRNRAVTRINKTLSEVEAEIEQQIKNGTAIEPGSEESRREIWFSKDVCLRAYYRMRSSEVTDQLAIVVAKARSIDEDSAYFYALRSLIRAWREQDFGTTPRSGEPEALARALDGLTRYLAGFDLPYRLRRLRFIARKLDVLYSVRSTNEKSPAKQEAMATLRFGMSSLDAPPRLPDGLKDMRQLVGTLYKQLKKIEDELMREADLQEQVESARAKAAAKKPMDAREYVSSILPDRQDIIDVLNRIIGGPNQAAEPAGAVRFATRETKRSSSDPTDIEKLRDARANDLLADDMRQQKPQIYPVLHQLGGTLSAGLDNFLQATHHELDAAFNASDAGRIAGRLFANFDLFDAIQFPMMFGTDVISSDTIDILRIAPEDAGGLIPDVTERRQKLKGLAVAHFGAFLDRDWRVSDLLWGRLDAAERLITSLLPYDENQPVRDQLIEEAHNAIFVDFQVQSKLKEMTARQLAAQGPANQLSDAKVADLLNVVAPDPVPCDTEEHRRLMKVWQDLVPKGMERETELKVIARATTIFGKMMETISRERNFFTQAGWITNFGRAFWGVVEISVPRTVFWDLANYWQQLILLIALFLIGCGIVFAPAVLGLGWSLLGFSLLLVTLRALLAAYIRGEKDTRWKTALVFIGVLFLLIALIQIGTWLYPLWEWLAPKVPILHFLQSHSKQ
ncbi:hypothetical protein GRAN_2251 [Granulicella sibirica]|uniref:PNPLA domain-containing protein n=2 Tax=Granulicella sibirica TaxID=2479048 RepID=A0A4Q0TBA6_9BACT|nr:hypothetical protein GRAN_2251 [Granulicella sibirica]